MSSTPPPGPDEIARDAKWLAQALDPAAGQVRLVAMDRDSYRAASFLDDRLMQSPADSHIVPWPAVEAAMGGERRHDARWIFHIGHVGSTVVSRLLGELPHVLAVREPRLLRDLALSPPEVRARYVAPVAKLMSRSFAADEIACVKATSFASEIAAELVPPGERALFMYASARNYVGTILAGQNSVQELNMLAGSRAQRLNSRGIYLPAQNLAEHAAAAWACEMTALEAAAEAMADRRIEWADFDRMLGAMPAALSGVAGFFGFSGSVEQIQAIASGPLMGRYSKALEHAYSPAVRRELIAEAAEQHARDIDSALAMLRSAAEKSPLLARSLARSREG